MLINLCVALYVLFICFVGAILLQLLHYTNHYFEDQIEKLSTFEGEASLKSPFKTKKLYAEPQTGTDKMPIVPEVDDNRDRAKV